MQRDVRNRADVRRARAGSDRRHLRIFGVRSAALATTLAAVTLALPATAAQASEGAGRQPVAATGAEPAATCHYRVNHTGGIRVYKQRAVGAAWSSFANGATFYSTCSNAGGAFYTDCPGPLISSQWKTINLGSGRTGYVKTKCLVRI
jgi:hypothetical protein